MNRHRFYRSTSDLTESPPGEEACHADGMQATTPVFVEVVLVNDSDELTETEWSAFLGLP